MANRYSIAGRFNLSGPIAVVVAGLLIGNRSATFSLSDQTLTDLHHLWSLIEEILNAVLFVLVNGLEMLVIPHGAPSTSSPLSSAFPYWSLLAPLPQRARHRTPGLQSRPRRPPPHPHLGRPPRRSGHRHGLLLIPPSAQHDRIVAITYGVVAFSILIQGTTLSRLVHPAAAEPI